MNRYQKYLVRETKDFMKENDISSDEFSITRKLARQFEIMKAYEVVLRFRKQNMTFKVI